MLCRACLQTDTKKRILDLKNLLLACKMPKWLVNRTERIQQESKYTQYTTLLVHIYSNLHNRVGVNPIKI